MRGGGREPRPGHRPGRAGLLGVTDSEDAGRAARPRSIRHRPDSAARAGPAVSGVGGASSSCPFILARRSGRRQFKLLHWTRRPPAEPARPGLPACLRPPSGGCTAGPRRDFSFVGRPTRNWVVLPAPAELRQKLARQAGPAQPGPLGRPDAGLPGVSALLVTIMISAVTSGQWFAVEGH